MVQAVAKRAPTALHSAANQTVYSLVGHVQTNVLPASMVRCAQRYATINARTTNVRIRQQIVWKVVKVATMGRIARHCAAPTVQAQTATKLPVHVCSDVNLAGTV